MSWPADMNMITGAYPYQGITTVYNASKQTIYISSGSNSTLLNGLPVGSYGTLNIATPPGAAMNITVNTDTPKPETKTTLGEVDKLRLFLKEQLKAGVNRDLALACLEQMRIYAKEAQK